MKYKVSGNEVDFGNMDDRFFLIGLFNEFMNRFQTVGDRFFKEISWKQCFVIICLGFFDEPPTIRELSELMGCSHQNIKQMLLKLEKTGYVCFMPDKSDKRKQRITLTDKAREFSRNNDKASIEAVGMMFEGIDENDLMVTINTIRQLDDRLHQMK